MKQRFEQLTFTDLPRAGWERRLRGAILHGGCTLLMTPNAETVARAAKDPAFHALLSRADLLAPDGDGLLLGARLAGVSFRYGKRAGVELGVMIARICAAEGRTLFLFGGEKGVARRAAMRLHAAFPGLRLAVHSGFDFDPARVADCVKASRADALLVCLGSPKQEEFMVTWGEKTGARLICGLGGSLDVYAGRVRRAPRALRAIKCEWLWRVMREPQRIRRLFPIPPFLWRCFAEKLPKRGKTAEQRGDYPEGTGRKPPW